MRVLLITGVVLAAFYFLLRDPDFAAFDAQREAWHWRCDAYIDVRTTETNRAQIAACQQQLEELTAYAKRKGW